MTSAHIGSGDVRYEKGVGLIFRLLAYPDNKPDTLFAGFELDSRARELAATDRRSVRVRNQRVDVATGQRLQEAEQVIYLRVA